MSKKRVLWIGIGSILLIGMQFLFASGACYSNKYCDIINNFINQDNLTIIYIMPFVFLFSLLTYKMRDEVFQAWWKFARWFVPVIVLMTWLINSQDGGSGLAGAIGGGFDIFILGIFYAVFAIVSLVKIILAYRKGK